MNTRNRWSLSWPLPNVLFLSDRSNRSQGFIIQICLFKFWLSEQRVHAAGDQLQGATSHGHQRGEEEARLPGGASAPAAPHGAGTHGQLGGAERHQEHHTTTGT